MTNWQADKNSIKKQKKNKQTCRRAHDYHVAKAKHNKNKENDKMWFLGK